MRQKELSDYQATDSAVCPTCGREFANEMGMSVHHSKIHGESIHGVLLACDNCDDLFRKQEANREGIRDFCSLDCRTQFYSAKKTGEDHHNWSRVTLECTECGEEFTVKKSHSHRRKRCSHECFTAYKERQTGENAGGWNGGKETVTCEQCGTDFESHPKRNRRFCSLDCQADWQSEYRVGPRHPLWKGGSKGYYGAIVNALGDRSWPTLANKIRNSFDECKLCHTPESNLKTSLQLHHLIPVLSGGVNTEDLLIPVCRKCHPVIEAYTRRFTDPLLVD